MPPRKPRGGEDDHGEDRELLARESELIDGHQCTFPSARSTSGSLTPTIYRILSRGFRAIQFNFVIASNERAVRLWQSCGFDIVGRLPGAFEHSRLGYVDALVMYRAL